MRYSIIMILTMLSTTVFAGNDKSLSLIEELETVQLNYKLTSSKQKTTKFQEMLEYEDVILSHLKTENEKYDQLVSELASTLPDSAKFERLDKELTKQKRITLKLLNRAEAVSRYVRWLRS